MAITYDTSNNSSGTNVSSSTITGFALGQGSGNDRIVVVFLSAEDAISGNTDVSSCTFNGTSMTALSASKVGTTTLCNVESYYILDTDLPSGSGSYDIVGNFGGTCDGVIIQAISIYGAYQGLPEDSGSNADASSPTSLSASVTTITDNAWILDGIAEGTSITATPGSGQTERQDVSVGTQAAQCSTKPVATAGSETTSWSMDSTPNRATMVNEVVPPSGAASSNGLLLLNQANSC